MASNRVRMNMTAVRALMKTEGVRQEVERHTRSIDHNVIAQGLQTRVDFQNNPTRPRGAVIAGYEDAATAENSRRSLLRALDGE